jgi:hypothetical protein
MRPALAWRAARDALLSLELWTVAAVLVAAIAFGPLFLVKLPGGGALGAALLLATGALAAVLLAGPVGAWIAKTLAGLPDKLTLALVLASGVVAQVLVALLTQPVPNSDGQVYLFLADKLAHGLPYQDYDGHRAFWPPGLPLFLSPFVTLFGAGLLAIATANVALFLIGAASAWHLGEQLFGRRAGLLAAVLFTAWPSRLLTAAVASKENLTIAAVLAGTALCVRALGTQPMGKALGLCVAAGLAFGFAAMAQPGLLLFVVLVPLSYRYFYRGRLLPYLACCAVIGICTALTLAPWEMRNCAIFDGKFCGVATNGGSVFYRANNPLATGEWTPEGEIPITHLPELEQNRLGFELGKRWIAEHPRQFLALAVRKLELLMRDDRYGAYWSVLRGGGENHETSLKVGSATRLAAFQILNLVSWLFWAVILAIAARKLIALARDGARLPGGEAVLPLIYPLLYSMAVFSVFESDRRQHMMAFATLLVLAAAAIAQPNPARVRENAA